MSETIFIPEDLNCRKYDFELPYCKFYFNEEFYEDQDDYLVHWCQHPLAKEDEKHQLIKCPRKENLKYVGDNFS